LTVDDPTASPISRPGGSDGEGAAPPSLVRAADGRPAACCGGSQRPLSRASHAAACHGRGGIAKVRFLDNSYR